MGYYAPSIGAAQASNCLTNTLDETTNNVYSFTGPEKLFPLALAASTTIFNFNPLPTLMETLSRRSLTNSDL
jgi:hypothetical protein